VGVRRRLGHVGASRFRFLSQQPSGKPRLLPFGRSLYYYTSMEFRRSPGTESTEWIVCSGTVYVNDPAAELPIEQGIRPDLPQLTSPGLDLSFLMNLHAILLGRTRRELAEDLRNGRVPKNDAIQRVAYSIPVPGEYSAQLYRCSGELCNLLASLEGARVADIVQHWHALLYPSPQQGAEPESGRRFRARVLPRLALLARETNSSNRKLMLRIEYRRYTKDATTGAVSSHAETRH
jgi:hypothetical protein